MRLSHLPGSPHLTYCTNIHAGESWPEIDQSLKSHLPRIRSGLGFEGPLGVGLRLSGLAADELAKPETLAAFKSTLAEMEAYVFTINAFPYGPFHGVRVKEEVYQPDWLQDERLRFTNLASDILAELLADGQTGSVSTVPGSFKALIKEPGQIETMARNYVAHAAHLVELKRKTGKHVALSIEPEPCCFLETIEETAAFFQDHLFSQTAQALLCQWTGIGASEAEAALRQHLGVCYDVCHAAVEFEDVQESIRALRAAGVAITKLQLSAAMAVPDVTLETASLLERFDEGVYLHQTVQRRDGQVTRYPDLKPAFQALAAGNAGGEWRVHCHVPVFLERLGRLASTQDFLIGILEQCRTACISPHLEVETYTWDVLPDELRGADKAQAIAREIAWVREQLQA